LSEIAQETLSEHPASGEAGAHGYPATLPPLPPADNPVAEASQARPRIDKSALTLNEPSRIRDAAHLKFVAGQPCLICGRNRAQAHHLRFAQPKAMGRKVSDEYTVPLCSLHHRLLHQTGNEIAWWEYQGIDPMTVAAELWRQSRSPGLPQKQADAAPIHKPCFDAVGPGGDG
jgi:hypothetical protein